MWPKLDFYGFATPDGAPSQSLLCRSSNIFGLQKTDVLPVMKASIVLCTTIFTRSSDVPEFIRQVVLPNLPKFISAVLPLLKAQSEVDLKVMLRLRLHLNNLANEY